MTQKEKPKSSSLRVALVGYGYWGPNLLRNLVRHGGFTVLGVIDSSEACRQKVAREYPHVPTFPDLTAFFTACKGVDAMVVATPPQTHADIGVECLKRGCHVLIEKPLAASLTECDRILEAADRHGKKVMVDHTFVYSPAVQRIQQEVAKGNLGRLLYYDSVRVNLGGFQKGTSALFDLAPHDLSILDFLLRGRMPTWVSAVGMNHFVRDAVNLCHVHLKYGDDFLVHLHLNWVAPVKIRSILLGGNTKMIVYDENEAVEKVKIYDRGLSADEAASARYSYRTGDMTAPQLEQKEALSIMIQAFYDYIANDVVPPSDGKSGRRIVSILEAAEESLRSHAKAAGEPLRKVA